MFASHGWMQTPESRRPVGALSDVSTYHPVPGALQLLFTLVVLSSHDVALFNNRSRNAIRNWAPQSYIDRSVNLAGMLWRCRQMKALGYILTEVDWTAGGPILQDLLSWLALKARLILDTPRISTFAYLEIGVWGTK
ncbi:unnamed protein product [Symbiodinium natans]|uniref:Uncharacterized protein n=1 Tax=Symbiodinium natans TaxID=878477 RepID=A0A812I5F1_9DINO|nr:unnamed protein product [Symbiodinium natans]